MNVFDKLINVLAKNLGYTMVLVAAIILFAVFSDGIIAGAITAVSALIGYACIVQLAREYKKMGSVPAPKAEAKPAPKPATKPAPKATAKPAPKAEAKPASKPSVKPAASAKGAQKKSAPKKKTQK